MEKTLHWLSTFANCSSSNTTYNDDDDLGIRRLKISKFEEFAKALLPFALNRHLALDMTSHPASATLAIVAFCTTALLVFQQQRLHRRSSRATSTDTPVAVLSARDRLIGAWVLTSYHVDDATTGARQYPLGHDAKGIIVSSSSVTMFVFCPLFHLPLTFSDF